MVNQTHQVIEDWQYHPIYGQDSRLIMTLNAKDICVKLEREYRPHTI